MPRSDDKKNPQPNFAAPKDPTSKRIRVIASIEVFGFEVPRIQHP
jgi:hypothetical protein